VSDRREAGDDSDHSLSDGVDIAVGLDSVPDAVLIADAESRRIVRVNTAAEELFRCGGDDLVGRLQTELHPSEDKAAYVEAFQRGLDGQRVDRLQSGDPVFIETSDGERIPVEITVERITADGDDYLMGVFREVSDQLARERALEQTTSRLETLLDALPVPVGVFDTDGAVEQWNQAAEEVFGYTAAEIVGQRYPLFTDDGELDLLLDRVTDGETLQNYRTTLRARDGSRVPVAINVRPIYEGGSISGVVGTAVDLSERHQREQQLDLLHRMARHNFRNELSVIRGWSMALRDDDSAERSDETGEDGGIDPQEATANIIAASDRLLQLSEEVVSIRNAVSDRDRQIRPVGIDELVSTLSERLRSNEHVSAVTVTDQSASGQVRAKAAEATSELFGDLFDGRDGTSVHLDAETADSYTRLCLDGDARPFHEGEQTLIQQGTETALRHASGLTIARAYLTIQSIGGTVELDRGHTGVPAASLQVELPRVDT
jgi:PAS domain S-box-containing protein